MKVIQSLKLDKQNIALFKELPCVKSVETDSSGNPTVTLHPDSTRVGHTSCGMAIISSASQAICGSASALSPLNASSLHHSKTNAS